MRITQGTFSFLPDLSDAQIRAQIAYCLDNEWAVAIEFTGDPHPRNTYWEMWEMPMFDSHDAAAIAGEISRCRGANPDAYIRVNAFDSTRGWETVRLSFIVNRPRHEPGLTLMREEGPGRSLRYTLRPRVRDEK